MSYAGYHRDLSSDPTIPYHLLEKYARSDDVVIRLNVAKHPKVTPAILSILAKDSYTNIRWEVAWNRKTPTDILLALRYDRLASIAWTACNNPCLTFQDQVFVGLYGIYIKNLP